MELEQLCSSLGFTGRKVEILHPFFAEFQQHCSETSPEFMQPEKAMHYFPLLKRELPVESRMQQVGQITAEDPAASFFANMLFYGFFLRPEWCIELNNLPHAEKIFGENTGIFYLMIALGAFPLIEKKYAEMKIPHHMAEKIGLWVGGAMDIYAAGHQGTPGFNSIQLHWLRHAIDGKLFRIGRLEYLLHEYPDWVPLIFRHRQSGDICLISRGNITYTADGIRPDNGNKNDPGLIVSKLEISDDQISGFRILPDGYADVSKTVTLDLQKWIPLAGEKEIIPSCHIPAGEPLTPEAIKNSLAEAVEFFDRYFQLKIPAVVSSSWLFFYEWQKLLPQSNIAAFAQEGFLFPTFPLNKTSGLFFVFGRSDIAPEKLPQRNSLEKAFAKILTSGGSLGDCGWLYLTGDIEQYGTKKYRRQYGLTEGV